MTNLMTDDSHVYCLWFVPFDCGDNFFAAMIRDEEGDRVVYRFETPEDSCYYVIPRGDHTVRDFKKFFNLTVEQFCVEANANMEYLPVDGGVSRALDIIEKQAWAEDILPG